jgi:hypothetical protein
VAASKGRFTTLKPTRLPNGMVSWDGTSTRPDMFFKVENAALELMDGNPKSRWRFMPPKYRWRCSCGAGPVVRADSLTGKVSREGDIIV